MKAYKGFYKNEKGELVCNGFVFKEGETYEHDGNVKLCNSGFHACEAPMDCFRYYEPAKSEYHEVDLDGVSDERSNEDTKRVAKSVKVGAKLDILMLVKAQFEYVSKKVEGSPNYVDSVNGTAAANGDYSSSAANGDASVALAWGKDTKAKASKGSYIVLSEFGDYDGEKYQLLAAKMVKIDGKRYKPDTWYTLKDGKVVKYEEDSEN
ncbi:MAG: hypothetical protein IKD54_08335 [Clostridia bacterium]|nr:hypothetical protein [Clostridia bacterium]